MSNLRLLALLLLLGVLLVAAVRHTAAPAVPGAPPAQPDWQAQRRTMVEFQLRRRGIADARVLDAIARVPRHLFVPEEVRDDAYADFPLPIGHGQTISQPYIVAFMTEALRIQPGDRVLEIGTGSGYQAAVLAELAREVFTIEIVPPLAEAAKRTLDGLGYRNVRVRTGNGYLGWPEAAPFDRIIITAAPEEVPPVLVEQLRQGGVMTVPVGATEQQLQVLRRTPDRMEVLAVLPVRFVPMVGKPRDK